MHADRTAIGQIWHRKSGDCLEGPFIVKRRSQNSARLGQKLQPRSFPLLGQLQLRHIKRRGRQIRQQPSKLNLVLREGVPASDSRR